MVPFPSTLGLALAYLKCCRAREGVPVWGAGYREAQVTGGAVRGELSRRQSPETGQRAEGGHTEVAGEAHPRPVPQDPDSPRTMSSA